MHPVNFQFSIIKNLAGTLLFSVLFFHSQAQKITVKGSSFKSDTSGVKELRIGGYQFISPLLDCYESNPPGLRQIKLIEDKLTNYISSLEKDDKAEIVSVYFRDLSNGPWMGINEDEGYAPASLLKVPYLISALKYAQDHRDFLNKRVVYIPTTDPVHNVIVSGKNLVAGTTYSMKELIENMIIYSDNESKNLLINNLPASDLNEIFFMLGIDINKYGYLDNFMSVKDYASFFRILYNATFLNKEMSEMALNILSKSNYTKGIRAGLPPDIVVANKFGERTFPDNKLRQLHDCGIIYKNKQPYILCVMTRGYDYNQLQEVIATISKIVYEVLKSNS